VPASTSGSSTTVPKAAGSAPIVSARASTWSTPARSPILVASIGRSSTTAWTWSSSWVGSSGSVLRTPWVSWTVSAVIAVVP
jgi:hypothetical protein